MVAERDLLLLRADATSQIGMGHFMRTLALAEEWKAQGGEATFLSRCENQGLQKRLEQSGIGLLPIEVPHPAPSDLKQTREAIQEYRPSWIVVDGYNFESEYHRLLWNEDSRLLVIDDCAGLKTYHADIILNQNISARELEYPCVQGTVVLLENEYTLLRSEFTHCKGGDRDIPKRARNLLVTLGGSDPDNITLGIIESLAAVKEPVLEVKVIVGALNKHGDAIRRVVEELRACHAIEVLDAVDDMAVLMAWADMAVSAAGSTCWELACMGLPSLLIVLSPDQSAIARGMDSGGCAVYLRETQTSEVAAALTDLAIDYTARVSMSERCRELIDGFGPARIVAAMKGFGA